MDSIRHDFSSIGRHILLFTIALLVCTVSSAAEAPEPCAPAIFLCGDTLATWRGDTGEWTNTADARQDPANPKALISDPGRGVLVNGSKGRTEHLVSKAEFGDVRAHVEFMVPEGSNSGVYFQGRYEIQVLDSWGVEKPEHSDCGGIYEGDPKGYDGHPPRINASRAPGEWQTFDVVFRAPRFDAQGKKIAKACFVEVIHNGVEVHRNVELKGPTRSSLDDNETPLSPMMFQGNHGPVAYRNIRITPLHLAADGNGSPMNAFFAMDTGVKDKQHTTEASRAAMLNELGYAGRDHTGTKDIPAQLAELDQRGLGLFAIYTRVNIDPGDSQTDPGLGAAMKALKGRGTVLWMPVTSKIHAPSSPDGDEDAVRILRTIADQAADNGLRIALYPHTASWVERVEDAVRVAKKVDRPNVGVTFNLCHWLKVDGKDFEARLKAALPHLFVVTINGADAGSTDWKKLIQPLDSGSFDVKAVLRTLDALGYAGPIGLQGYGIGGDVHDNLKRSMGAWQVLTK